jgi:hypothetical protein
MTDKRTAVAAFLVMGIVGAAAQPALGHEPFPSRYTYQEDILPIIQKNCSSCHRPGGIAPMSLLEYQEAISWANSMKIMVLEGLMPPWLPKEGVGQFSGARSLSAEEIDMIVEWASGGTPEGETLAQSTQIVDTNDWSLGDPDRTLEPTEDILLTEDESEKVHCLVLPSDLDEDRWISALEFKPGAPSMVHDVTIHLGEECSAGQRPIATWLPGDGAFLMPEGVAEKIPAGSKFALRIHYRKTWVNDGTDVRDRSKLGLYYASKDGQEVVQTLRLDSNAHRLAEGARILALFPIPSSKEPAEPIKVVARRPDGGTISLFEIDRFDPSWSAKYQTVPPVALPPGTVLEASSASLWIDYLPSQK